MWQSILLTIYVGMGLLYGSAAYVYQKKHRQNRKYPLFWAIFAGSIWAVTPLIILVYQTILVFSPPTK